MVYIDEKSRKPKYIQIYDGVKAEIVSGILKSGDTMPPIRKMAQELCVSKNTIDRVYQELLAEGYINSIQGSGFFVAKVCDTDFSYGIENNEISLPEKTKNLEFDFKFESLDSTLFPWNKWRKCVQNAIYDEENLSSIDYNSSHGTLKLRTALTHHLLKTRGVKCSPEQIMIFAGTQFCIQVLASILPVNKHKIAFENPGYNAIRDIFKNADFDVMPITAKSDGIDIDELNSINPNIAYITPSRQFPMGYVTSFEKRISIIEWARKNDSYIIENDYDSDFLYSNRPIPALQSIDASRVIYINTFSKILAPSLRCAYMVLPQNLLKSYHEHYELFNSTLPSYHQNAIAEFITDEFFDKHVHKMSVAKNQKHKILLDAVSLYGKNRIEVISQSGSHAIIEIKKCSNSAKMIEFLAQNGIGIYAIDEYFQDSSLAPQDKFLVGNNSMKVRKFEVACTKLAKLITEYS